jgi:hypothetical protein
MKLAITLLALFALVGCSTTTYLVDKKECSDVGPEHLKCTKVFKIK